MTARLPELRLLAPVDLVKAAERILAQPSYNVQRVSTDEIYTFATATTQFAEICTLVARLASWPDASGDGEVLTGHLTALGFLPPHPAHPASREETTSHG